MTVWQQYRRVDVGTITEDTAGTGVSIEDLDMKITVENPGDSEHNFDVEIYNLADETWRSIDQGDSCRITLGWASGERQNVMVGVVKKLSTSFDGNDKVYRMKGVSQSDQRTKLAFSHSWGPHHTPTSIARDIARNVGLTIGDVVELNQNMNENFSVSDDRPVRYWFDQLVAEAERMTDVGWEWFVDGGRFYFVRQDGRTEQAVRLSYDNTLLSLSPIESDADEAEGLEFEAMMEPNIRGGAAVAVDVDGHEGAYKVREYTFTSDSVSGDHKVEGKLDPLNIGYEP